MYLSSGRAADSAKRTAPERAEGTSPRFRAGRRVAANVLALGLVSFLTDISSEMVSSVLPLYYTSVLGLTMLQTGFLDGLFNGASVFLRLAGAHLADRFHARKPVALAGYALSAVCKLGLPAAGASLPGISTVLAVDRSGKGLRTAPRDALISLSSTPETQGRAFGVHRTLDTAGAFGGPLIAFAVLSAVATAYDAVFMASFCVAAAGVLVLLLFVRERSGPPAQRRPVTLGAGLGLLRDRSFGRTCLCVMLLETATISDAFVYLTLQHQDGLAARWFPLLALGTAAPYLLLSLPLGSLADRVGPWRLFLAGHVCFLGVLALLGSSRGGPVVLGAVLALHGVFYAATDAPLMAHAAALLPVHARTSGFAVLQSLQALAMFASSLLFGVAYRFQGPQWTLQVFGTGLLVCLVASAVLIRDTDKQTAKEAK
ncbi:MFS transporter [Kitasatospora sp. GP82]|uniref:MFS transporter n=1 Tax=Kitasatospora sp. GP82 TaxID=3035089 RepID=UPI0024751769|nr:MFS transporter [Kitasatospora sp. GP82]MDH6123753.1 sugar phosphate permease [Kitasatospora sp. GP82]